MYRQLLTRIEELKGRMTALRSEPSSSTVLIGIQALEQEVSRLARQLPPEWSLAAVGSRLNGGGRVD